MKPHTYTNRSLCECELYTPANYDNDPQMKEVMDNFNRQTQQRFHEYDERMKTTRQKCRERCVKEIQKIILKDKIEKEFTEKLSTLQTDISINDLPTCVCEKSLADKVEKECLKCAQNLGGMVAPSSGVLLGIAEGALIVWKDGAIIAAKDAAIAKGLALGKIAGDIEGAAKVVELVKSTFKIQNIAGKSLESIFTAQTYTDVSNITTAIYTKFNESCMLRVAASGRLTVAAPRNPICSTFEALGFVKGTGSHNSASTKEFIKEYVQSFVSQAKNTAGVKALNVTTETTATLTAKNTGEVNATYMGYQTPIIAAVVAIVVIVLIMLIIYLILRYRRKKKMKKKLQYIKLLEE